MPSAPWPRTLDPAPWLDGAAGASFAACSSQARQQAQQAWAAADAQLSSISLHFLEDHLQRFWHLHRDAIRARGGNVNQIDSAADMYRCWPSSTWFGEAPLPIIDHIDYESGDSSYNAWVFDRAAATPIVGRILCDMYLRRTWPCKQEAGLWAKAADAESFVALAAAEAREDARHERRFGITWEFQMRPVPELMESIWWDSSMFENASRRSDGRQQVVEKRPWLAEGPFVPRRPAPCTGLSILHGQESIFMTWDRLELWVYDCYVD
mmetsp:Transcript_56688/g.127905  ORF Transcript_56688/g.127905 Transcript_56688/m.127905 type:complete len:266 (-) Transcript_56688:106-903(-)